MKVRKVYQKPDGKRTQKTFAYSRYSDEVKFEKEHPDYKLISTTYCV